MCAISKCRYIFALSRGQHPQNYTISVVSWISISPMGINYKSQTRNTRTSSEITLSCEDENLDDTRTNPKVRFARIWSEFEGYFKINRRNCQKHWFDFAKLVRLTTKSAYARFIDPNKSRGIWTRSNFYQSPRQLTSTFLKTVVEK